MKTIKGTLIKLTLVIFIVVAALTALMLYERNKERGEFAEIIISQGRWATPDSVNELRAAIARYDRRIERHVNDAAKNATYWKLLAIRLQDRGLHGEALEALERAIYYSPEDPILHYTAGLSAGIMAKSFHIYPGRDNTERNQYNNLAESSFLRSIELDERYLRPRYGLGVLYVFDLDRPEDAIPHLEFYLNISRNDVDTLFVLARAYYMLRRFQEAVEIYDRIIVLTGDQGKRIDAQNNRQVVLGYMYG